MSEQAVNCKCAAMQQSKSRRRRLRLRHHYHHEHQRQSQFHNCKCRKKYSDNKNNNCSSNHASMPTITPSTIARTAPAAALAFYYSSNYCYFFNFNLNKINKSLITALLLLITMTTNTIICQIDAASLPSSSSSSSSSLAMVSAGTAAASARSFSSLSLLKSATSSSSSSQAAATVVAAAALSSLLSPTQQQQQQRQLQQQQLFALLTKNRQATSGGGRGSGVGDDTLLHRDNDDLIVPAGAVETSLETTGFVADDGQQYEKAERALVAAVAATVQTNYNNINNNNNNSHQNRNMNANNCPKECKCLNDFFDCGKKHLDYVPELPNYVQILDLVGNKLNDTTVLQIKNLSELHKLSLKRNQLEIVPTFAGLNALKQLNLANNRIQRISSEALIALPKLKSLDLSKNYLHTVELNYFPATNHLAHLTLNSNEISNIDENAFEHMGELLDLELNNNRLTTLPAGAFKNLHKLRKLSLNDNNLEINWSTFRGLSALQKLFLKSNRIRALQDGIFHVMRAIEIIELDHNHISSLNRQGLFNLTKLQHLSLSNNSINRIELDTWEFTQSLVTLDLSHNNISEFKPQHLDCLHRLRYLNLANNKIQYLGDTTFDCVKNLEDLNLRRNKLAWIIEDPGAAPPFKALRKLKKLDLYGNNLKQINSKSLSGLISLESLNLKGNALASIQSGAFDSMPHMQKLTLKSVNFICDCDLLWFRRWLQRDDIAAQTLHSTDVVCGYPDSLLDRELVTLTPAELICADTPKPVITQEPSNQLTVKGANVTMECIGNSPAAASLAAAGELKIKWRHNNQNIRERERAGGAGASHHHQHHHQQLPHQHHNHHSPSTSYSTTETQIHHDQNTNQTTIIGYLRLYNVSYENAGKYQCVISNAFGTKYSQNFKISIGIHPSFLQIPSNLTIDSGDTARLVCSATGDPMPEIALQKFGGSDFPAATERRLQVLREENAFIITNAKPIDTGIYTCTAESAAGEIKINASLIVNDKPQPEIPQSRKEIVLGDSSVLECLNDVAAAELQQPSHREWYKDNKPIHTTSVSTDAERYYFTAEKELLVIVNTQSVDSGQYRCEITDNSKTFIVKTELIVVQEDISQTVIIATFVLCIIICLTLGSFIIYMVYCCQKRKPSMHGPGRRSGGSSAGSGGGGGGGVGNGARVAAAGSQQHMLSGSHGSALDQTQMSTLNRTYLQLPKTQPQQQHQQQQQRPRSLADLVITATPNYQQLLKSAAAVNGGNEEGFTLQYLNRNSMHGSDGVGDGDVDDYAAVGTGNEHNQDHLSSKDSGTGSDAAVKRSMEDFTMTIMPPPAAYTPPVNAATVSPPMSASTPTTAKHLGVCSGGGGVGLGFGRASLAKADPYDDDDDEQNNGVDDDEDDNDAEIQFAATHALGVSVYGAELCELNPRGSFDEQNEMADGNDESARFLQNNNHRDVAVVGKSNYPLRSNQASNYSSNHHQRSNFGDNIFDGGGAAGGLPRRASPSAFQFNGTPASYGAAATCSSYSPTSFSSSAPTTKCKTNAKSTNYNSKAAAAAAAVMSQAVDI